MTNENKNGLWFYFLVQERMKREYKIIKQKKKKKK